MKVLIIGGTGHTGSHLARDLTRAGHQVVSVSRGRTRPYATGEFWQQVEQVTLDRQQAERDGALAALLDDAKPDAVVDIVCYEPASAEALFACVSGKVQHVVHVGTAWIYGDPKVIPTPESYRGEPLNDYARNKLAVQDYYLQRFAHDEFPVTMVNPTQITGAGKGFITPEGDKNPDYIRRMRAGEELPLPAHGRRLVHHVHPADVARVIGLALANPSVSAGQVYNAASARAITYRGLFHFLRDHFGAECTARPMSLEDYQAAFGPNDTVTQHMIQSTCVDIRKPADQLGYRPAYSARQAVIDSLDALTAAGKL